MFQRIRLSADKRLSFVRKEIFRNLKNPPDKCFNSVDLICLLLVMYIIVFYFVVFFRKYGFKVIDIPLTAEETTPLSE